MQRESSKVYNSLRFSLGLGTQTWTWKVFIIRIIFCRLSQGELYLSKQNLSSLSLIFAWSHAAPEIIPLWQDFKDLALKSFISSKLESPLILDKISFSKLFSFLGPVSLFFFIIIAMHPSNN